MSDDLREQVARRLAERLNDPYLGLFPEEVTGWAAVPVLIATRPYRDEDGELMVSETWSPTFGDLADEVIRIAEWARQQALSQEGVLPYRGSLTLPPEDWKP